MKLNCSFTLNCHILFVFSDDIFQIIIDYVTLKQKLWRKKVKCLSFNANLPAYFSHQIYWLHVKFLHHLTTLMLGILESWYQLFNTSDFSVCLPWFLCHFINCQLNTVHDLIFYLNFVMLANNLFDFMNAISFDTIQFLLDFLIVVKLFV